MQTEIFMHLKIWLAEVGIKMMIFPARKLKMGAGRWCGQDTFLLHHLKKT